MKEIEIENCEKASAMQTCLQLADRKQFIKVNLAVLVNVSLMNFTGFLLTPTIQSATKS